MFRRNRYLPLQVDLIIYFASGLAGILDRASSLLSRRWDLMDKHCQCPKCQERREKGYSSIG